MEYIAASDYEDLLYGRAFRAPSFSELYSQNNPVVIGNPDLKPETINTIELDFAYEPVNDLRTGLSIYKYHTEDMIDFVPNGDGTNTAQNINSLDGSWVRTRGGLANQREVGHHFELRLPENTQQIDGCTATTGAATPVLSGCALGIRAGLATVIAAKLDIRP